MYDYGIDGVSQIRLCVGLLALSCVVIEVDDGAFHRTETGQSECDELKSISCTRYGIPLFRFSTTGSDEKEKMCDKLRKLR